MALGKHFLAATLICACILSAGCDDGSRKDAEGEAKAYTKEYAGDFKKAVQDRFGDEAYLKDIEGKVEGRHYGVWFDMHYDAYPELDATLVYDGKEYDITYNTDTGEMASTLAYEQARDSILAMLPLDTSKVTYCEAYDWNHETPMYSLKDGSCDANVFWNILTTEDISCLTEKDFAEYKDNTCVDEINIYACKKDGFANLDHFKAHKTEFSASDYGRHPKVYQYRQSTTSIGRSAWAWMNAPIILCPDFGCTAVRFLTSFHLLLL